MQIINYINHQTILKFIGYSPINFIKERKPVIFTETSTVNSLENILQLERNNVSIDDFLDDFLLPKNGDFGISTKFYNWNDVTYQSVGGLKWTPIYLAPEILQNNQYSKASDVYAFSFIVYEILSNEIPYNELNNFNQIISEVIKGKRPEFSSTITERFQKLIAQCWASDPSERTTFEDIVVQLKKDSEFISKNINKNDYEKYIKYIDEQTKLVDIKTNDSFDSEKTIKVNQKQNNISQIISSISFNENQMNNINDFISNQNANELMNYLDKKCEMNMISSIFDKCFNESK